MMDCSVCFCSENIVVLGCSHFICEECVCKLCSDSCPICRKQLTNISDFARSKIKENIEIRKKELEAEYVQLFLEHQNSTETITEQDEIDFARETILRFGIPEELIPEVSFTRGNYPMIPGTLYMMVVVGTLEFLEDLLDTSSSSSSSNEDEYD